MSKIIRFSGAAVFAAGLLLSAGAVSAQTPDTTPFCHTFNTNLTIGTSGTDVEALHQVIRFEGVQGPNPTHLESQNFRNSFMEDTASMVTAFQEKYRSEVLSPVGLQHGTGYVGPSTRAKLNKLYGCEKSPVVACAYAPAPPGCTYVKGPNYEPVGDCGLVLSCPNIPGCAAGALFNSLTGEACVPGVIPGCGVGALYSSVTGQSCSEKPAPSISGVSGPTSLAVGQQGTWRVMVSDLSGGSLSYSVKWGDGVSWTVASGAAASESIQQTATFSHSYSAGTWNPTFTVTNQYGLSAQTSISVKVGTTSTVPGCRVGDLYNSQTGEKCPVIVVPPAPPQPTLPFCGQPAMPKCPSGVACIQKLPDPKTYTNYIDYTNDRAWFLYSGVCTSAGDSSLSGSFTYQQQYASSDVGRMDSTYKYQINNYRSGLVLDVEPTVNCSDSQISPYKRDCSFYRFDLSGKAAETYVGVTGNPYTKGGAGYRFSTASTGQLNLIGAVMKVYAPENGYVTPVPDSIDFRFILRDVNDGGKELWSITERAQFKG